MAIGSSKHEIRTDNVQVHVASLADHRCALTRMQYKV